MSAVQMSLLADARVVAGPNVHVELPEGFTKGERKRIGEMIEKLWGNSEKTLKATAAKLWQQKRTHFTNETLLIRNISRRMMVDEAVIRRWRKEERWPRVNTKKPAARPMHRPEANFITEDDELADPLEQFINQVYTTRNQQAMWDRYCRLQGVLLPEEIRLSNIRYVLDTAPITCHDLYALFQQEAYSFARYLDHQGLSISMLKRHTRKVPLNTLINQRPHLRQIAARYARRLYTNRGVPIAAMADRLGIAPVDLWSYGASEGEWCLPDYTTLTHIISESVLRTCVPPTP